MTTEEMEAGYREMAANALREASAHAWAEAFIPDLPEDDAYNVGLSD